MSLRSGWDYVDAEPHAQSLDTWRAVALGAAASNGAGVLARRGVWAGRPDGFLPLPGYFSFPAYLFYDQHSGTSSGRSHEECAAGFDPPGASRSGVKAVSRHHE